LKKLQDIITKLNKILFLLSILVVSCSVEKLQNPINVETVDFDEELFLKSTILFLPPSAGENMYVDSARMVLEGILKKDYNKIKMISPETAFKLIKEKNLTEKLKKVYSLSGDEEDNALFAAAIGIDLGSKFTVYSKITNVISTGSKLYDTETQYRYNPQYHGTEEFTARTLKFFRRTVVTGFFKIVDNEKRKVVWSVGAFQTMIENLRGFKSVPLDDVLLQTYGDAYMSSTPLFQEYTSASKVIYRFYERIISQLP